MSQLYKYQGSVSSFSFTDNGHKASAEIVLGDIRDWDKAPTRIEAFGGLAKYINAIEGTDAEERYIKSDWYFDRNLYLHRIEIPTNDGRIAKVITQADFLADELVVFGPHDYIETDEPEPMDGEQSAAWYNFRINH
jgi:hypothetical protein